MLYLSNYMAVLFGIFYVIKLKLDLRSVQFLGERALSSHNCVLSSYSKGLGKKKNPIGDGWGV